MNGTVIDFSGLLIVVNQGIRKGRLLVGLVLLAEFADLMELVWKLNVAPRNFVPEGCGLAEFAA